MQFHGGCDLVLLDAPAFANGLGLTIHIRTKIETWWSFIEAAVIKIGKRTFELRGGPTGEGPHYWVDGMLSETGADIGTFQIEFAEIPGFRILYKKVSDHQHKFVFFLNNQGDAVNMHTFKDWVAVDAKIKHPANFDGAKGLMGSYPTGAKMSRDGVSIMNDITAFGKEWQVQATEPMLFHNLEGAQHPQECVMPDLAERSTKRRRLGEAVVTADAAKLACAHASNAEACIFDVLATDDISFAGAY